MRAQARKRVSSHQRRAQETTRKVSVTNGALAINTARKATTATGATTAGLATVGSVDRGTAKATTANSRVTTTATDDDGDHCHQGGSD